MIAYFDTSALIKLVLEEEGSDIARRFWAASDVILVSRLGYPEARTALARAFRLKRITPAVLVAAKPALSKCVEQAKEVEITSALARRAGDLAERHRLRGYDAVHLACATAPRDPDLVMTSWDDDLRRAAGEAGLTVAAI